MSNPFHYGGLIKNPTQFVGREIELKRIFSCLEIANTGQPQCVSIVGPSRTGKSSLLYYITQSYRNYLVNPEKYKFIFIDLKDSHCHTLSGLLFFVLGELKINSSDSPTLFEFQESIRKYHKKTNIYPVLCLDDFEYLAHRKDEFPDSVYMVWRSMTDTLSFIITSQSSLSELTAETSFVSPFYNIFVYMHIGDFNDSDVNVLLERGQKSDRPFSKEECKRLISLAGSHPAKLQIAASILYNAKENTNLTWRDLETEYRQQINYVLSKNQHQTKARVSKIKETLLMTAPKSIGHFFLEILGRTNSTDTTSLITGWIIIILIFAILIGWIQIDAIKEVWIFFFPTK